MPELLELRTGGALELGIQYRAYKVDKNAIDEEARTVEIAFSSEEPADRFWSVEILDHAKTSVRMARINDGGALLLEHDRREHVGIVEKAWIDKDKRGRALVRFGKGEKADAAFQDVIDGIKPHISVGYRVHKVRLEEESADGPDVYRVVDWEPVELSFVSIPMDHTVGVGRSAEADNRPVTIETRSAPMPDLVPTPTATAVADPPAPASPAATPPQPDQSQVRTLRNEGTEAERTRVREILELGEMHKEARLARKFVDEGKTLNEFQVELLKKRATPVDTDAGKLGMDTKEKQRFSLARLLNHLSDPQDAGAREKAAFELEVCQAARKISTNTVRGQLVPFDVLEHDIAQGRRLANPVHGRRDLVVGTATAGGHTVDTELRAGDFIQMLYDQSAIMGQAQAITGLTGNVAFPRQTGATTPYWVAEAAAASASDPAFDQLTLSPKTVTARSGYSRQLLLQSELAIEQFLRVDLARQLNLSADDKLLNGDGTGNTMTGLLNFSGIGAVAVATDGGDPLWEHLIKLKTEVAVDNAMMIEGRPNRVGYLFNAATEGKLQRTAKNTTYGDNMIIGENMRCAGYDYRVSNQLPSNLTKGSGTNLSAAVFANWYEQIIGMWGGLDIIVDPYTNSHQGSVRVSAFLSMDTGARHAEAFAAAVDFETD